MEDKSSEEYGVVEYCCGMELDCVKDAAAAAAAAPDDDNDDEYTGEDVVIGIVC